MKAIFDVKPGSQYDDDLATRYHFPARSTYLAAARAAIGDWIVYREPQRNRGRRAYVALARVVRVDVDMDRPGFHYAYVDNYMNLPSPVSFVGPDGYAEEALRLIGDPRQVGRSIQGKSIRPIDEGDFLAIMRSGFGTMLQELPVDLAGHPVASLGGEDWTAATPRRVEEVLLNRVFRDANFRHEVMSAYGNRCAVTGLELVDWRGNPEVNAAHLLAVSDGGPDIVQNGIAMTATVHWLFDRHCISVDDDYGLLIDENRVPRRARDVLFPPERVLRLPADRRSWPSPKYLASHRATFDEVRRQPELAAF